jgi:hypothetical protein
MGKYVSETGIEPEIYLFEAGEITRLYSILVKQKVK